MAFASYVQARHPLGLAPRGFYLRRCKLRVMLRTGKLPVPSQRRSSCASTPRFRSTPAVLLPGTLASPQAGLPPAGCRELVARLRRCSSFQ